MKKILDAQGRQWQETFVRNPEGFEILRIDEFEEGELPRRLFLVTLRKK